MGASFKVARAARRRVRELGGSSPALADEVSRYPHRLSRNPATRRLRLAFAADHRRLVARTLNVNLSTFTEGAWPELSECTGPHRRRTRPARPRGPARRLRSLGS